MSETPATNAAARTQMEHASRLVEWQTRSLLTGTGLLVAPAAVGFGWTISNGDEPALFVCSFLGLFAFIFHRLWIRAPRPE
ncbi:hypothetical protein GCM10025786_30150 [Nocardioides caeni]